LAPSSLGEAKREADPAVSWGFAIDFPVRADGRIEVFYDRQELDFGGDPTLRVAVDYLQAGGVYEPRAKRQRPFVAASFGLTRYDGSGASHDDALALSGSVGGGVKILLGHRLALRLEARGYVTFGDATLSVACGPGCTADVATDGTFQLAGRVGLAIGL